MSETAKRPSAESALPHGKDATRQITVSIKNVLWPLMLSILVLVGIGYFTFEPDDFKASITQLQPFFVIAAAVTIVLRVWFGAWRFSFISRGKLGFWQALRGQLAWDFFSNVTPAALGGGPFAAIYVAKDSKMQIGETTALVLFTILLDQLWSVLMVPIILYMALSLAVIPEGVGTVGTVAILGYFAAMLTWVSLLGYSTLFRPDIIERISDRIFRMPLLRRFRERMATAMGQMSDSARILRSQPLAFFGKAFLLSAGTWIPRYLLPVFIVLSVLPSIDAVLLGLRSITMMVCSFVVPTPGGAGGIEGLYALFIGPLLPKSLVAPTLLMWRFLGYYIFVAMGGFIFRFSRKEPDEIPFSNGSHGAGKLPTVNPSPEPEFVDSEE